MMCSFFSRKIQEDNQDAQKDRNRVGRSEKRTGGEAQELRVGSLASPSGISQVTRTAVRAL